MLRERLAGMTIAIAAASLLSAAATPQVNTSRPFGPGVCGPVDPTYLQITNETGGQPFFLSPAEVAKSAQIMTESSRSDGVLLLWASGTAADAGRGFGIPVDGLLKRLTIAATFDTKGGALTISSPDGAPLAAEPRIEDTVLNCGRVISIDAPQAGAWRVSLSPSGRFWLTARGRSDFDLLLAEFVQRAGRPGHEGFFRIQGQPVARRPATLRVRVMEPDVKTIEFALLSTRGQQIQRVQLARVEDQEFFGTFTPPLEPFRVASDGLDSTGARYQRVFGTLFHAELVELKPGRVETLSPGQDTPIPFVVSNAGPRARFRVVAADTRQYVTRVDPAVLDLDEGAEQTVSVWLRVPAEAAEGTRVELTVTATSVGPSPTSNGAVQQFTIGK